MNQHCAIAFCKNVNRPIVDNSRDVFGQDVLYFLEAAFFTVGRIEKIQTKELTVPCFHFGCHERGCVLRIVCVTDYRSDQDGYAGLQATPRG